MLLIVEEVSRKVLEKFPTWYGDLSVVFDFLNKNDLVMVGDEVIIGNKIVIFVKKSEK